MASTVYYGKSTTGASERTKVVRLYNLTENEIEKAQQSVLFNQGDLVIAYFSQKNLIDGPQLSFKIGDTNQEISFPSDSGKNIYNKLNNPALSGCWGDGETVTFVYTGDSVISDTNSATYYWEMVEGVTATDDTYGFVTLDKDDNGAISRGAVLNLLGQGSNLRLESNSDYSDTGISIGTLDLINGQNTLSSVELYAPAIPTTTGAFINNGSGTINGGFYLEKDDTDTENYIKNLIDGDYINSLIEEQDIPLIPTNTSSFNNDGSGNVTGGRYLEKNETESINYIKSLIDNTYVKNILNNNDIIRYHTVYTYDLQYPAEKAIATTIRQASSTAHTWSNTFTGIDSSGAIETHVFVECVDDPGYTPIGVIGYNVSDAAGTWDSGSKRPAQFYLWAASIQTKNDKYCVHFQGTNKCTTANNIRISFRVLYRKS